MLMKSRKSFSRSISLSFSFSFFAAGIYLLKLNNKNSRARCTICLNIVNKDTRKTLSVVVLMLF